MFGIRFLKKAMRVGEFRAKSLPAARARADEGFDDADQAVIVRLRDEHRPEYVEVRKVDGTRVQTD